MNSGSTRRRMLVPGAALGVVALALSAAPASATVNDDGSTTIDLLNITDFHGALVQAPNIATQVAQFRADNPDTVFSSSGDSIGGSTFESALAEDQPTIDVLNAAGLEVSAVGNHEFDKGYADLTDRVIPAADWSYLGANVGGADELAPYEIIQVGEGESTVDVAFVGTVTDETPTIVSPGGIEGLTFDDPIDVTNQLAAELSDGDDANGEADVVVALIHEGGQQVAAGLSPDVDVAFAGHSHLEENLTTASGAPLLQASASGGLLAHVQLTVAQDGTITVDAAENLPVTAYEQAEDGSWPAADPAVYDETVAEIVQAAFADAEELGQEQVGTVLNPINGASNDGTPSGSQPPANRGSESPLGNLLAEIAQATANDLGRDADFGIINPGGIRADLDPNADGVVTFAEAFGTSPFGNTIGTVDLTGDQVIELLEQQFFAREDRPMLALGLSDELSFIYVPTAEAGEFVTSVFFEGAPIDPAGTYTVAANTFLLDSGDGFSVLGEGANFQETGYVDVDGVIDYLEDNPDLDPSTVQQSVGITPVSDLTTSFAPGEDVTIDLSSLAFTTGEPTPSEVRVLLDGEEVATAEVDTTITPGTNETGQATATFTVPEYAADGALTVRYEWDVQAPGAATQADAPAPAGEGADGAVLGAGTADDRHSLLVAPQPMAATVPAVQYVELDVLVQAEDDTPPTTPAPSEDPEPSTGDDDGGAGDDDSTNAGGQLPATGADLTWMPVIAAIVALLVGGGLLLARRRRI